MGQAFDRDGHVLGEAYGETKKEVFDKLIAEFKDAHEIRIKSMGSAGTSELPRYRCHKEVGALKIAKIHADEMDLATGGATITPAEEGYGSFQVSAAYLQKHKPKTGGYFVVYMDGYQSFSPAKAFEEGYTRIP